MVLPIGEIWITVRNTGSVVLFDLELEPLSTSPGIAIRAGGRLPERLAPGADLDIPLVVGTHHQTPDGEYQIPYVFHAELMDGCSYDKWGELRAVIDHPPQITAPSSIELKRGDAVAIAARDPQRRTVHLEAMLPPGIDLAHSEPGHAELHFATGEIPGTPRTTVTLVAWAGNDRHTARVAIHEIEIMGGDIEPPPWFTYGAYGALTLFLGFVYLRERWAERADDRAD